MFLFTRLTIRHVLKNRKFRTSRAVSGAVLNSDDDSDETDSSDLEST